MCLLFWLALYAMKYAVTIITMEILTTNFTFQIILVTAKQTGELFSVNYPFGEAPKTYER